MKVKICGLIQPEEAAYLNKNQADFAGFVLFFPKSKRNITCEQAQNIFPHLAPQIRKVAVVVSPTLAQIQEIVATGFDYIQIHGSLPGELLDEIPIPVLRAFNAGDAEHFHDSRNHPGIAGFVFDAAEPGSGKTFDWNSLAGFPHGDKWLILAGGLTPENVAEAIQIVKPDVVDVSSGVEYAGKPGKDPRKIHQFIQNARGICIEKPQ